MFTTKYARWCLGPMIGVTKNWRHTGGGWRRCGGTAVASVSGRGSTSCYWYDSPPSDPQTVTSHRDLDPRGEHLTCQPKHKCDVTIGDILSLEETATNISVTQNYNVLLRTSLWNERGTEIKAVSKTSYIWTEVKYQVMWKDTIVMNTTSFQYYHPFLLTLCKPYFYY